MTSRPAACRSFCRSRVVCERRARPVELKTVELHGETVVAPDDLEVDGVAMPIDENLGLRCDELGDVIASRRRQHPAKKREL